MTKGQDVVNHIAREFNIPVAYFGNTAAVVDAMVAKGLIDNDEGTDDNDEEPRGLVPSGGE